MKIYLGGPINGCTDAEAKGWRQTLASKLREMGHDPIDPMRRDYRGRELKPFIAQEIVEGDLEDIRSCEVVIFNCPKPSYGTAMEMFFASREGKTVFVVLPWNTTPSPWVLAHCTSIVRGCVENVLDLVAGCKENIEYKLE